MEQQTNQVSGTELKNKSALSLLLTPSWISILISVLIVLFVVGGTFFTAHFEGSQLQFLYDIQKQQEHEEYSVKNSYYAVDQQASANSFINNAPLIIVWAGVGLISYYFVAGVFRAFKSVNDVRNEINYVHADRQAILKSTFLHLGARLVVLVVWLFYLKFTFSVILPYVVAVTYASTIVNIGLSAVYLLAASLILLMSLHLHVILARLLFLRPRLFSVA